MTAARHKGVSEVLCDLRDRIASMEGGAAKRAGTLAFGVPEIDAALPAGGLLMEPCMSLRAEDPVQSTERLPRFLWPALPHEPKAPSSGV